MLLDIIFFYKVHLHSKFDLIKLVIDLLYHFVLFIYGVLLFATFRGGYVKLTKIIFAQ